MLKSFREYLFSDRNATNTGFYNDLYNEAAGQTERKSVQFDMDDIDFLKQFDNIAFWSQALHQRYDMLFHALHKLDKIKDQLYFPTIVSNLKAYLQAEDRNSEEAQNAKKALVGNASVENYVDEPFSFTEDEIRNIDTMYPPEKLKADAMSNEEFSYLADHIAEMHWWKKLGQENFKFRGRNLIDDLDNKEKAIFRFAGKIHKYDSRGKLEKSGAFDTKSMVQAYPYLNRLYHKLSTNYGDFHIAGSGLDANSDFIKNIVDEDIKKAMQKGKYGFELRTPVEGKEGKPHTFRKTQFPTREQSDNSIKNYLQMVAHRVVGKLDDPDIVWLDSGYVDSFEKERILDKERKRVRKELTEEEKSEAGSEYDISQFVECRALDNVVERFKNKDQELMAQLTSPPYPPQFPQGIPPVHGSESGLGARLVMRHKRQAGGNENCAVREEIKGPPLFLPFKYDEDKKKFVPVLKESHFYREKKVGEVRLPSEIVGRLNNFVKIDPKHSDPTGKEIQKEGGLFLNHNTPKQLAFVKGTNEYRIARKQILDSQDKGRYDATRQNDVIKDAAAVRDTNGKMIYPIIAGVVRCIKDKSCGQKTQMEINLMMQNIDLIYKFAYAYIENDFGDNMFYKSRKDKDGTNIETDEFKDGDQMMKAVENRAHLATRLLSQRAWTDGGDTKRRRTYTQVAFDERQRRPLYQARHLYTGVDRTPEGDAPPLHFPYKPENYSEFLRDLDELERFAIDMENEQKEAATTKFSASLVKARVEEIFADQLRDAVAGKEDLTFLLANANKLYNKDNPKWTDEDALKYAQDTIKSWEEQGLDLKGMIEEFKNLDSVRLMQKTKTITPAAAPAVPATAAPSAAPIKITSVEVDHGALYRSIWSKYYPNFSRASAQELMNLIFSKPFALSATESILDYLSKTENYKDKFVGEDFKNIESMLGLIKEFIKAKRSKDYAMQANILKNMVDLRKKYG